MRWPWQKRGEPRALTSISDPSAYGLFSLGGYEAAGVSVGEHSAMTFSAFYRAVSLISGTLASLPMPSYRKGGDGPELVASVFDDPDAPEGQTAFEWRETLYTNLVLWGRAGALKMRTAAGGISRLPLLHPSTWSVRLPTIDEYTGGKLPLGGLWFDVAMPDGSRVALDASDFWYVPGLSLNGKTGLSLLSYARLALGTGIAGDKAAANMFANGMLIAGLITPEGADGPPMQPEEVPELKRQVQQSMLGHENAASVAVFNRQLKFQPFTMSAVDAQFLQSRQFQIEEIARFTGVPPHLLMQTDKQTSWGTGVDEQNRALGRTVLKPWSDHVVGRASRLLANPRWVEVDFSALERSSPDREAEIDLKQVQAGVMTVDEYRLKRGWKPLPTAPEAPVGDPAELEGDDDAEA